jgi:hypothetical protein
VDDEKVIVSLTTYGPPFVNRCVTQMGSANINDRSLKVTFIWCLISTFLNC